MVSDYKPSLSDSCYKTAAEDNQTGVFTKSIDETADKIRTSVQVYWINMDAVIHVQGGGFLFL